MYDLERRHLLRHDMSFNTLFRHMQGNEGVFDRWSNRLSRIEAALQLPVGTFADYNPLRSGEYEEALKIAKSRRGGHRRRRTLATACVGPRPL